ncbi:hypothetical protein [Bacteroides sp. 224]|uniref:hypothetical protein n=1 Tax=Bacteroides sp. 224 TaxID=2302936 RepID=UPI0013D67AAE|nr:hypothetical protein [Bacteroides sp. 224]NDV66938.1 hypothetical protein [Bacteroides sp. 224]
MNKEWENIIDRYIRHELTKEEYIEFEELMQSDPEFAREVKLAEQISISIERLNEEKALKEMLSIATKPKRSRKPLFITLSVAASIAVILYIGLTPKFSSEQLFNKYYTALPYEEMPSRSDHIFTNEQAKDIEKAISLYTDKKYQEAVEYFHKAINQIKIEDVPENVAFYAALSEIETKETDNALEKLIYLSANGELFMYDAKWYLALLHLQKNNREEAMQLLNELTESDNLYQGNAIELILQLKLKKWF